MDNWTDFYKDLDIPTTWENISYCNDELPSFQVNQFQVWIDQPDSTEFPNRFCVMRLDDDNQTIDDWFFESDNFQDVLNLVN